jgi:hypothetical protein
MQLGEAGAQTGSAPGPAQASQRHPPQSSSQTKYTLGADADPQCSLAGRLSGSGKPGKTWLGCNMAGPPGLPHQHCAVECSDTITSFH